MTFVDLGPAAQRMGDLVRGVPPADLDRPTPCATYAVADLLDHIAGLTIAFADAARKSTLDAEGSPPEGDGAHLAADWRERMPEELTAWRRRGGCPARSTG